MPSGCGYNMMLGNELMTTLRADIMQSLKVVRFQVGNCVTLIPMLPREARPGDPIEIYFKVDCSKPWINNLQAAHHPGGYKKRLRDRDFWRRLLPPKNVSRSHSVSGYN
jgi:hypothetical protein